MDWRHSYPQVRRRPSLPERRRRMPIIDVAGEPLDKLQTHWRRGALPYFLWFRVLRPLTLLGLWVAVAAYAWVKISGVAMSSAIWQVVLWGSPGLLAVLLFALTAPLLRGLARRKAPHPVQDASVSQLARYARLPAKKLSDFQRKSTLLSVEHDEHGYIRVLRQVEPGNTVPAGLDYLEASSA